jgi:hypothetical protein
VLRSDRRSRREAPRKVTIIRRKPDQELADLVGCARETVAREIGNWRRNMHVSWDPRTMRLEVEALCRIIGNELLAADGRPRRKA